MSHLVIEGAGAALAGRTSLPGDKSISHRALMLGALASGTSRVRGFLPAGDCLATVGCVRALGVDVERPTPTDAVIHGRGLGGLRPPSRPLNCVRSGTTMRLLSGILAGQPFASEVTGAPQLLRRPMRRITRPLRSMGAEIEDIEGHGPLSIRPGALQGRDHVLPVASAQVKSAILLAGLYASGQTVVHQPGPARDHTERMLAALLKPKAGDENPDEPLVRYTTASVHLDAGRIGQMSPMDLQVPGDLSSAAFLITAALLVPGSEILLEGLGMNPTRTGYLDVLKSMGADIAVLEQAVQEGEPVGTLRIRAGGLNGVEVFGDTVVRMIDEFPILAVAATQAEGTTVVRDAAELRVKETDRIAGIAAALEKMGGAIETRPDGFVVEGPCRLRGAVVDSQGDHRLAMALAVAGLIAEGETVVASADCVSDSFPGFSETLQGLGAAIREVGADE
jgi:3-phosphoshikimate 1-carboxyvinyltransferase